MLVRFNGFKQQPYRDHIIILSAGKHQMVKVGESVDLPEEDAFRLRATGEWDLGGAEKGETDDGDGEGKKLGSRSKVQQPPPASNRAILDGKVE